MNYIPKDFLSSVSATPFLFQYAVKIVLILVALVVNFFPFLVVVSVQLSMIKGNSLVALIVTYLFSVG